MDSDGGSTDQLLRCPRDGVETRLLCSECQTPICPGCFVRTAVGLRCQSCGAASGPSVARAGSRRRGPVVAAIAVVVALVVAAGAWAATRGSSTAPSEEVGDGGERIVVPLMALGSGQLPAGLSWRLEARRDGGVCTTLHVDPGPPARERCLRARSYRPVGNLTTRLLQLPSGPVYLTLGQVSDRTERVRIAPDGTAPYEVPTLGGGTGLDVRFFVTHTTENVHTAFTALAADGSTLGRVERPKLPPPR